MKPITELDLPKAKINQLRRKGLETTEDLLKMMPLHYDDFTKPKRIWDLIDGEMAAVYVKVVFTTANDKMLTIHVQDEEGEPFEVVFFNQYYMQNKIKRGKWYTFGGKVKKDGRYFNMANPFLINEGRIKLIQTRYSKIKGMSDDYFRKALALAEKEANHTDDFDQELLKAFNLVGKKDLFKYIHRPTSMVDVRKAKERLLFEDLFAFNVQLLANQEYKREEALAPMGKFGLTRQLLDKLPFQLTSDQSKALREISLMMKAGKRVNALVQGDVGSGKTMVALFSMLIAAESGFQSAIMAPTNVLAKQHFQEITELLKPFGIQTAYLSGELKAKEKREAIKAIKDGTAQVVIGTHAVISKTVHYKNLGLIVVDEEHRFGVVQRESFAEKGGQGVHVINMSATPIPRSLAMSLYGDDVMTLTIKSMPAGRIPIHTVRENNEIAAYQKIHREILKGRQAYIVCPLIEENFELDDVESVEETYKKADEFFSDKGVDVGVIHGRMKPEIVAEEIGKFASGEYDILVSTTIIEVGVNVPNATAILIKSAERFGLAQLHQLRGRVGRSTYPSTCLMLSNNETDKALFKLNAMTDTTDGFIIAQKDMELRGTGDLVGTDQSGLNKAFQLMLDYPVLHERIRLYVKDMQLNEPSRWQYYKTMYAKVNDEE